MIFHAMMQQDAIIFPVCFCKQNLCFLLNLHMPSRRRRRRHHLWKFPELNCLQILRCQKNVKDIVHL